VSETTSLWTRTPLKIVGRFTSFLDKKLREGLRRMPNDRDIADDVRLLHRFGYAQELARRMSGFSNYALSLSIICILAGCVTSFHVGYCSVGGAAIGLGWPLCCALALAVALSMGQLASAFPTAGGLYHWASILGGRGSGWAVAWLNLLGLVTVLAAINVGACRFVADAFFRSLTPLEQLAAVGVVTASQALFNHRGIDTVTRLTDFSGWWIVVVAAALTAAMLWFAPTFQPSHLVTFDNFSGLPADDPVWPATGSVTWLFALGLLLPAYTVTGFDASAHASEETVHAAQSVPRGMVRSVLVSGIAGWIMLAAIVLAIPDPAETAAQGSQAFFHVVRGVLPGSLALTLFAGIALAQYLCGLATVTSASRMTYAFARDGALPGSHWLRHVDASHRTPAAAIWVVAAASVMFTVYTPVYETITAVCVIFLYLSYIVPIALGLRAYGRTWTQPGPWNLGRWYRPLSLLSVLGGLVLMVLGVQPPNEQAAYVVAGVIPLLVVGWFAVARHRFPGPPHGVLTLQQQREIAAAEEAVHQPQIAEEPET
jgi:amino acid transporter